MNKFIANLLFMLLICVSSLSHASLITDSSLLTSEHYVTYSDENITIDFAWVSPINVEFWGNPELDTTNQLFAPDLHDGWDYASDAELDILLANFSLADFTNADGTYKHAVQFWNTVLDDIVVRLMLKGTEYVDKRNLANYSGALVSSQWASSGENGHYTVGSEYETFYVRRTFNTSPTPVNEPTTLLILAFALIALSIRSRLTY